MIGYQHLRFELYKKKPKTNVYKVYSKYDETELGFVLWYPHWRQYVYDTDRNDVVWSYDCLFELINFIRVLNIDHKLK